MEVSAVSFVLSIENAGLYNPMTMATAEVLPALRGEAKGQTAQILAVPSGQRSHNYGKSPC